MRVLIAEFQAHDIFVGPLEKAKLLMTVPVED